jgi:tetrahydromethanopterin S-methyltransferase subunit C
VIGVGIIAAVAAVAIGGWLGALCPIILAAVVGRILRRRIVRRGAG